ncbi:DUF2304 family protein [Streptococcus suis]
MYFNFRNINKNKILYEHDFIWIVIGFGLILFELFDVITIKLDYLLWFGMT